MKVYLLWDEPQSEDDYPFLCGVFRTKEAAEQEMMRLKGLDEYPQPRTIEEKEVEG